MHRITTASVLLLVIFLFTQCAQSDFKTDKSGLTYKFIVENKGSAQPKIDDVVSLKMRYTDQRGTVLQKSDLFRTRLKSPSHEAGSIEDAILLMHKGDSAIFHINAINYYTKSMGISAPDSFTANDYLTFYIKLMDIMSADEFAKEQKLAKLSDAREEERLMNEYLDHENITIEPTASGLYFIEIEKGKGKRPQPGKKVIVQYTGYFIDGQIFDSSYKRNEPFSFTLGVGEVIQGWDEGVSMMHVGGKYKLIIPSYLAYGSKATGPIPPNVTLVFDVELLNAE